MKPEARAKRHEKITEFAYGLLAEKGYRGMTMSALAKAAKASHETLYAWYGDKDGLIAQLVADNAEMVSGLLDEAMADDLPAIETLHRLAPLLLELLTGERAVALNRAAAADPTGQVGVLLSRFGRETVAPKIGAVIGRAVAEGTLDGEVPDLTELFIQLVIGDLQIRRAIGVMPAPTPEDRAARAARAMERFMRLAGRA